MKTVLLLTIGILIYPVLFGILIYIKEKNEKIFEKDGGDVFFVLLIFISSISYAKLLYWVSTLLK
jgi:hypothetical protein